jgi:type IV pilus assembly protein PilY1
MRRSPRCDWSLGLFLGLWVTSLPIQAEDIDIFVGGTGGRTSQPNILFVLDNSANWSRNDQHWLPAGVTQGQAEVRAIRNALAGLTGKANVGLMMYATRGNHNDNGYVRHALKPLSSTHQNALNSKLDRIYDNIETPTEKRQSNPKYGYLLHDVYNYLTGSRAVDAGFGTPSDLADPDGYATAFTTFRSPLTTADICTDTYLVFIGNPQSNGPSTDDSANSESLARLVTDAGGTPDGLAPKGSAPIPIPRFVLDQRTEQTELGYTSVCYKKESDCTQAVNTTACTDAGFTACACTSTASEPVSCGHKNGYRYMTLGSIVTESMVSTGQYDINKGAAWNLDDWVKFLYLQGVPIPGAAATDPRARVITYTIDVFNNKQNADHTGLLMSAAKAGVGGYFFARDQETLEAVLSTIISEIISVNSTFASASLPISATNRAQNENQVFIGMFRPEPYAKPRWFGNLKRYQLARFDDGIDLADADGRRAVNTLSGFVAECAASYWTRESGDYWSSIGVVPDPLSRCISTGQPYSDKPDGPFVEKGAAAQMLRESTIANRVVYTRLQNGLVSFTAANSGLDADLVDYSRGMDVDDMNRDNDRIAPRPTIHGDIVHSRPLPVNYGSYRGVTVYYGANDGTLRAVDADDGTERWSFIAPEHFGKLERLRLDQPLVAYPNQDQAANPLPKDYFFDGSIGQVIRYGDDDQATRAWIYPTMRRGGRMIYAFNVTDPRIPRLMWFAGCPNVDNDVGCSAGLGGIGQTWSLPNAGYVGDGLGGTRPVLVMGGGYAACEDDEDAAPDCGSDTQGKAIFVIDAETGTLLKRFATDRAVPADVSLVDHDFDGTIDFGYAADTGGSLYRISFIDASTREAVGPAGWQMLKIAETQGGGRKFLYGPAVMAYREYVYLALGSGNREQPLDTDYPYRSNITDRFYVFLDTPLEGGGAATGVYPIDLDDTSRMFNFSADTGCNNPGLVPGKTQRGWFMNLPNRGEQTVTNALIVAGMATFSTSRPGGSGVGVCARPIGIAAGYWVNLFNASGGIGVQETCGGRRSNELAGGGLPPAPVLATVPVDGKPTTVVIGAPPRDGSTGTPISPQEIKPAISHKRSRLYWSSDVDR